MRKGFRSKNHQADPVHLPFFNKITNDFFDGREAGNRIALQVDPFQIYLDCYRVLRANGDPRAEAILDAAYRLLQAWAAKIDDEELRRSYLENVAAHREIAAAWHARTTA